VNTVLVGVGNVTAPEVPRVPFLQGHGMIQHLAAAEGRRRLPARPPARGDLARGRHGCKTRGFWHAILPAALHLLEARGAPLMARCPLRRREAHPHDQ
jgi:hypothetical protein